MRELLKWLQSFWWAALIGGSCLIEFTPIKLNPISAVLKWIGKRVNGELLSKINAMETKVEQSNADTIKRIGELETKVDQNEIDRIRNEVLDFANSCRNGRRHTKDEFEHTIALNTKYEELLKKYDKKNGVFVLEYEYIVSLYRKCQQENNFL